MFLKETKVLLLSLVGLFLLAPAVSAAQDGEVVVAGIKNKAGLGDGEVEFLDGVVRGVFSELPNDTHPVVSLPRGEETEPCDDECLLGRARELGAAWLVVVSVSPLGDGYATISRLLEVSSGQVRKNVSTPPKADLGEIQGVLESSAKKLRDEIMPLGGKAEAEQYTPPAVVESPQPVAESAPASSVSTLLIVKTNPSGAKIFISRDPDSRGKPAGDSPVEKQLLPVTYWVTAELENHQTVTREVRLDPSSRETVAITLPESYPASPYKIGGHVSFWAGVGVTGFGIYSAFMAKAASDRWSSSMDNEYKDRSTTWAGLMWSGLGVGVGLMALGVVLWTIAPDDKEYFEKKNGAVPIGVAVLDGGLALSFGRRF